MHVNMPMRWYKFLKYVTVPIGIIIWGIRIIASISSLNLYQGTSIEWVAIFDILIAMVEMGLLIGAANGVYRRIWMGIRLLISAFFVLYINNIFIYLIGFEYGGMDPAEFCGKIVGTSIVYIPFIYCNYVYFNKRREYFIGGRYFNSEGVEIDGDRFQKTTANEPINFVSSEQNSQFSLIEQSSVKTDGEKIRVRVQKIKKHKEQLLNEAAGEQLNEFRVESSKTGKRIITTYILAATCALFLCSTIALSYICIKTLAQKASVESEYEVLQTDFKKLQENYRITKEQLTTKNTQLVAKFEEYDELEQKCQELQDKNSDLIMPTLFLRNEIGFIVGGSNYYHNYDCEIFQKAGEYWAHNIEYCKYIGYAPCPLCWE